LQLLPYQPHNQYYKLKPLSFPRLRSEVHKLLRVNRMFYIIFKLEEKITFRVKENILVSLIRRKSKNGRMPKTDYVLPKRDKNHKIWNYLKS
jgi:hypothetical protein